MLAIKVWLDEAQIQLNNSFIYSARLDAELMLAFALVKNRTYLHAHADDLIIDSDLHKVNLLLEKRLTHVPIAYIIGYKEFYGRQFSVTPNTLIPRPESEVIIEVLKDIFIKSRFDSRNKIRLFDIGTGSGCLGITAKLEFPVLDVTLCDISSSALKVASENAKKLLAKVSITKNDLLKDIKLHPDIIIANLPYVDKNWERSKETNYEPPLALFATNGGKSLIKRLLIESVKIIRFGGYVIIEADPMQHIPLIKFAKKMSLDLAYEIDYIIAFKRTKTT